MIKLARVWLIAVGSAAAISGCVSANPDFDPMLGVDSSVTDSGALRSVDTLAVEQPPGRDLAVSVPDASAEVDLDAGSSPDQAVSADLGIQQGVCQSDEVGQGGRCYYVHVGAGMRYAEAQQLCAMRGALVLVVDDAGENAFAFGLLPSGVASAWIGLRRTQATPGDGDFEWDDGSKPSYLNWAPGEPNNAQGIEACVLMWGPKLSKIGWHGRWNDAPCDTPTRPAVICERVL